MVARTVRWAVGLGFAALWWWAVLRIALGQGAGILEGAVAAGGWGLSLLPVHCVPKGQAVGALSKGRWVAAWREKDATTASPHPRSGEVSDPW